MVYQGRIRNGVVVMEGQPGLLEGTLVNVEPVESGAPQGSPRAVLRFAGIWADAGDEVDRQLQELARLKQAELDRAANMDDQL